MSALFQSKVETAETSGNLLKQEMDSLNPSGKRPKAIKMTEDTQSFKNDVSETHLTGNPSQRAAKRPQAQSANMTPAPTRPCLSPTPPSKEAFSALYQQRQKCELKRLLKHTCPELGSLDGVVDEELADVWGPECTAADTGYQGEVLSRRWIFENCALDNIGDPDDSKTYLEGEGRAPGEEQKKVPPRVAQSMARPQPENSGTTSFQMECSLNQTQSCPLLSSDIISKDQTEGNVEEESMVRADVRSTRMMFESQKIPKHTDSPQKVSTIKVVVSEEERGAVKKQMKVFNSNKKTKPVLETQMADLTAESSTIAQEDDTEVYTGISKVKDVFERKSSGQIGSSVMGKENKGFVSGKYFKKANCKEREKKLSGQISLQNSLATQESVTAQEEIQKANVKDRAHLFESIPFHKINCIEGANTTDMSMNERLSSLYHFSVIHSNGTIVESVEAGAVKKATFDFTSGRCPEIQMEEVITGNIKNTLLQILHRAHLTSYVKFIKEDEQGNVEVKSIDVPVHQLPFIAHQDREYRTVNLVQVVEDLLNIDSSSKKGIIIQETSHEGTQVSVYSLFSHEELDMKRLQTQQEENMEVSTPEETEEEVKGDVKGTIRSLLASFQEKIVSGASRVEEGERGNVKLFSNCIEKGDLEYLKSLQKTPSEEELNSPSEEAKGPIMEENVSEIVPGNVKNIKNIFSCQADMHNPSYSRGIKAETLHKASVSASNTAIKCPPVETIHKNTTDKGSYSMPCGKISDVPLRDPPAIKASTPTTCDENQDKGIIQQEELVEAVEDDLCNLQAAILSLQQATMEAKALQHSIQEKQEARVKQEKTHITERDSSIDQDNVWPSEPQQKDSSFPVSPNSFPVQDKYTSSPDNHSERVGIIGERQGTPQETNTLEHQAEGKWEMCETSGDNGMAAIKEGHLQETIQSLQDSSSERPPPEEEKEEIVKGNIQAALKSLGQSSVNVTQGDFRAAMIYRNAGKSYELRKQTVQMESVVKHNDELVTRPDDSKLVTRPDDSKLVTPPDDSKLVTPPDDSKIVTPPDDGKLVTQPDDSKIVTPPDDSKLVTPPDDSKIVTPPDDGKLVTQPDDGKLVTPPDDSNSTPTASAPLDQQVAVLASNEASAVVSHSNQCKTEPSAGLNTKGQHRPTSKTPKKKGKKPPGPRPAIPPKPDHLKAKPAADKGSVSLSSLKIEKHEEKQAVAETCKELETKKKPRKELPQSEPMSYKDALCKGIMKCPDGKDITHHESTGTPDTHQCDTTERKRSDRLEQGEGVKQADCEGEKKYHVISNNPEEASVSQQEAQTANSSQKGLQVSSANTQASNEFVSGFQAELKKFAPPEKNVNKSRPVKPKRMKTAKDNVMNATQLSTPQQCNSAMPACCPESYTVTNDGQKPEEGKVVMREKKVKKESEQERMQRLSVHRDEIMRGNETAAMEIFDNLRKKEELKIILSKVEEIEEDTSEVDVKALRTIFENVPDWIRIKPKKIKPKQAKTDLRVEKCESPTKGPEVSSMALAFGDLEKASVEILNLKEQTLAKLVDIEEAIRKALLSVSTLKSESDIAGLSGLFKESMASAQASPSFSNIQKISIGTSKSQKAQRGKKQAAHVNQSSRSSGLKEGKQVPKLEIPAVKHRATSPSSPSFISIESGVRKESDPPSPSQSPTSSVQQRSPQSERFQSTKDLMINTGRTEESKKNECPYITKALSLMDNPFNQCHVNVLEVQTVPKGESGKKMIKEEHKKTDITPQRPPRR
ncbi:LIM domain-containing protein isoform X2 [Clupea harengus]|nr:LIM domain-containing protein isoform X2 [Clupea harengus]